MFRIFINVFAAAMMVLGIGSMVSAQSAIECVSPRSGMTEMRIINGRSASPKNWPFIVQVRSIKDGSPPGYCGGSLITQDWVLTAAHCFSNQVSFTVHSVTSTGKASETGIPVSKAIKHPKFGQKNGALVNDIMLLKLSKPVKISNSQLALLPTTQIENKLSNLRTCAEVAGWGVQNEQSRNVAERLSAVNVKQLPVSMCQKAYGRGINSKLHVCAGYEQGGKDSCQGDSGGPLIIRDGPTGYLLVGVVSFGRGCARAGFPGVYGRASAYRDWIFKAVEDN
jgi:secreted trypsin-like serine protease